VLLQGGFVIDANALDPGTGNLDNMLTLEEKTTRFSKDDLSPIYFLRNFCYK
jgi:hypothetical protein